VSERRASIGFAALVVVVAESKSAMILADIEFAHDDDLAQPVA
jgi:hypothetical protein